MVPGCSDFSKTESAVEKGKFDRITGYASNLMNVVAGLISRNCPNIV